MARPCLNVLTTPVVVCAVLLLATAGNAEIRGKPAGAASLKSAAPMKSTPAKNGADQATEAKSANNSSGTKEDDGLADDDSPKRKSGGKDLNDKIKKKGNRKGTKDSRPTAKNPFGRSRNVDATGQQIIAGSGGGLEKET